jgi:hypothetical protein
MALRVEAARAASVTRRASSYAQEYLARYPEAATA